MSMQSLASTTLKSAVKRFRIRPRGTVSIHRSGVRRMVKLSLSNSFLEARIEPVKIYQNLKVPISEPAIENATYIPR
jgi:hypothetical protein